MAIEEMVRGECEEVVLEAEVSNTGALALYRSLGFIRDKHLHRYGGICQCMRQCKLVAV
jgi:peptide alpha-N-acetyltransferase